MPSENKYEIRSQEVQEILSTPPRFLTFWGTALVVLVLIVGLVFLSNYKLAQTVKLPVQVVEVNGRIGLIVDSALGSQVTFKQQLKLKLQDENVLIGGSIFKIIDTAINLSPKKLLLLSEDAFIKLQSRSASKLVNNGVIEIQTSKKSLLQMVVSEKSH